MYHAPQLTSEVMAFAKEHEKTMNHCEQLKQIVTKVNTALSPLEQSQVIIYLNQLELDFSKELEPHYYNEENALFPILGQHIGTTSGIIPDIINEHETLRTLFQQLQFGIHSLGNQWTIDHVNLVNQASQQFISFMEGHIEKEDKELYPQVENLLSIEEKRQVYYKLYANVKPGQ
jgi:hemerythrin-like domain-containing protein